MLSYFNHLPVFVSALLFYILSADMNKNLCSVNVIFNKPDLDGCYSTTILNAVVLAITGHPLNSFQPSAFYIRLQATN
jgi:hypothetical protein